MSDILTVSQSVWSMYLTHCSQLDALLWSGTVKVHYMQQGVTDAVITQANE